MSLETIPQTGEFALDIVQSVFVFSSVVVLLGYLLNRKLSSSSIRKTVWQTGILAILVFVAITVTGQGNAISQFLSSHFLAPHSLTSQSQEKSSQPATELHTSFESDIPVVSELTLLDILPADPENLEERLVPLAVQGLEGYERNRPPDKAIKDESHRDLDRIISSRSEAESVELVRNPLVKLYEDRSLVELHEEDSIQDENAAVVLHHSKSEQNLWLEKTSFVFIAVWGIGSIVFLARILVGRLLLVLYCRRLHPANDPAIENSVSQISRLLGHRRTIRILESRHSATPIAVGIFRPTLILPTRTIVELDNRQRDVILAHEIAHLSSYDPAWTAAMDVLLSVLWWHPAVWYLKKQLNHVNEHYADDASLVVEGGPTSLAECLVDLGARLLQEKKVEWVSLEGIPMSGRNSGSRNFRSSLGQRVARLLSLNDRNRQQFARPVRNSMKVCGSLLIVASVLVGQTWANPGSFYKGESTVSVFKNNWKKSLASVAILSFIGSHNSYADDAKKDDGKEKKIVLELKEAKPAQAQKHVVKKVEKIIELAGGKAHEIDDVIIELAGGIIHEGDPEHVVLKLHVEGEHDVFEVSGSPDEIKKKITIHLKKAAAELTKAVKTGDKKKVIVLKKKIGSLKKVISRVYIVGGQGKVRVVIKSGDNKKATSILQKLVIGDVKGTGKIRVVAPIKVQEGIRVIRANQLDKVKLKLLIEKAAKGGNKVELKRLYERVEANQKSAQSRTRRSGSKSRSEFSKLFGRAGRPQASRKLEGELAKIREKISHLKKAAESLKAAGLKEKAQELLVTAEKLAAVAKDRAAQLKKAQQEKERAVLQARRRQAESRSKERQAEARRRTERRRVEADKKAESRSRTNRTTATRARRSRNADVNAELLRVIRQLSKEMKELRKDVNDLKKKVNK